MEIGKIVDTAFSVIFLFLFFLKTKMYVFILLKKQYTRYRVLKDEICVQQYGKSEDWVLGTFKILVKYITFCKKSKKNFICFLNFVELDI